VNARFKFLKRLNFWQIAHVSGASLSSSRTSVCIDETRCLWRKSLFVCIALSAPAIVLTSCAKLPRHSLSEDSSSAIAAGRPRHNQERSTININSASTDEIAKLPGIGKVLAERIVSHREQHGSFRRPEHLLMVRGISDRKYREISSMLTVD
jgi:competence ComEA-like helix-hairpin-helix protein